MIANELHDAREAVVQSFEGWEFGEGLGCPQHAVARHTHHLAMETLFRAEIVEHEPARYSGLSGDILKRQGFERSIGEACDTECQKLGTALFRGQAGASRLGHGAEHTESCPGQPEMPRVSGTDRSTGE